ncbi:CD209 antigen-like protein C isoform X2 [Sander vitreus]
MGLRIYYLTAVNQDLETERNNLRGQIQNISRAQWSIDEYCPKVNNDSERRCSACQKGWRLIKSSCYLINDPPDQKTWEEAREDCRERSSDLVVVHDDKDEYALYVYSRYSRYANRSWIGLRAEGGRWKWIDGSDLTESVRYHELLPPPTDGQCVVSDDFSWRYGWKSESCAERYGWICQKEVFICLNTAVRLEKIDERDGQTAQLPVSCVTGYIVATHEPKWRHCITCFSSAFNVNHINM